MPSEEIQLRNKYKLPCPNPECDGESSASLFTEPKPHIHCFKCEHQEWDEDVVEEWTLMNNQSSNVQRLQPNSTPPPFPKRGVVSALDTRGIRQETAQKFGVEKLYNSEKQPYAFAYPYHNTDGELVAQKIKGFAKEMKCLGEFSKGGLFGKKAFPKGGKYLTITEGEEDAMAVYQMVKDSYGNKDGFMPASVSIKSGVAAAVRDCKADYEYINSFEEIIVCFDGDPVGRKGAQDVAQLFPHKVKVVAFPETSSEKVTDPKTGEEKTVWKLKDASDYLKDSKQKEFISLWWKAEKYVPSGVRTFRSLWDDMTKKDSNSVVPFPWKGLNGMCHGMVTGKMDVFKAHPKIGKTTLLSELVMHIRDTSSHNVGVIFLENTTKEIGLKFCGIRMNEPIDRPEYSENINWEELKKVHEDISDADRITIFDPTDERSAENVMKKIMYFVKAHDCKYIFLDHASMLAYTSESMDERKFLDKLFADLKQLTTALDIYLGVVIHVNDDGKTRGSRAPVQLCDRLFSLQRDKLNDDPIVSNTTEVIVEENRWGSSGLASKLLYDNDTGRMMELDPDLETGETVNVNERQVKFDD